MKIKTIKMFRNTSKDTWLIKTPYDDGFICGTIWNKMFPRLKRRKKLTMTVYTHAVKGSRKFVLIHPSCRFYGFIQSQGLLYYRMELAITAILAAQKKTEMPVWVTFE